MRNRTLLVTAIVLLVVAGAFAQADKAEKPAAAPAQGMGQMMSMCPMGQMMSQMPKGQMGQMGMGQMGMGQMGQMSCPMGSSMMKGMQGGGGQAGKAGPGCPMGQMMMQQGGAKEKPKSEK